MGDIRLNRREVADLIRDGTLLLHCPGCATEFYLRLTDLGATTPRTPGPSPRSAAKAGEEQPKCVSCGKPITAYAFAVRRGLCPDCFVVMGARLDKPGQPREPPPPEPSPSGPPASEPGSGP